MKVLAAVHLDRCIDASALDRVHDALATLWRQAADVSDTDRTMFEIAVLEVAGNIVEHGTTATDCTLDAWVSSESLEAVFRDDALAADVDIDGADWPDEWAEGGRGLPMARSAVDDFSYRRVDARNVWQLRRARSR